MRPGLILLPKQARFCQLCWNTHRHTEPDIIMEWPGARLLGACADLERCAGPEPPSDRSRGRAGRVEPARRDAAAPGRRARRRRSPPPGSRRRRARRDVIRRDGPHRRTASTNCLLDRGYVDLEQSHHPRPQGTSPFTTRVKVTISISGSGLRSVPMEDAVDVSTAGSSGQIVIAGAGYAGLHVALRLTAKLRNHAGGGADPGRPARLPPGAHRAASGRRRHPRRRRGAHPAPGRAGQAGPLRPDRDQWLRLGRPAAAHRGWADRLDVAGAGARQQAQ